MAKNRVETKVTAASAFAYLGSTGLLATIAAVQDNARLISWMPDSLSPFVLALLPTAASFVAGWAARHTPREE
ncbi:holin [Kitasatospora sp. NPDC058046]|uniref:holin n=1 Tax=Kitasatospora sp. NPDC058046 TaxID=3346312 RepID=UPI0036DC3949